MKNIGFIDNYIDQWHAHNYPRMIRQSTLGGEFRVSHAWAQTDPPGKMPLDDWCKNNDVQKAESLQQVVESCDYLIVLSPDNPEKHEELADLPLRSGKPVYIDKPLAPSLAAARRIFDKASAYQTPVMSCSALRFAPAIVDFKKNNDLPGTFAATLGGGAFDIYAIHQVEMLVMLLGLGARRARREAKGGMDVMIVDYDDDRLGTITLMPGHPFEFSVRAKDKTTASGPLTDFFPNFIEGMLEFFRARHSAVSEEETLEIASILEAGARASTGGAWAVVPSMPTT